MITPPWHTATTRLPGIRARSSVVDRRRRRGRGTRRAARRRTPPSGLRSSPCQRSSLVAAQLLHRDVVVGLARRTRRGRRRPRPRGRARPRSAPRSRRARRCGLDTTTSTGSAASQSASRCGLVAPVRGERGIGGHARSRARCAPVRAWRTRAAPSAAPAKSERRRVELGERVVGIDDLDRGHAHRARRLEVDAEVVEEHGLGRVDVERGRARARRCAGRACAVPRPPTRRRRRSRARRAARRARSGRRVAAQLFVSAAVRSPPSRMRAIAVSHRGPRRRSRCRSVAMSSRRVEREPGRRALRPRARRRTRRCVSSPRSSAAHAPVSLLVRMSARTVPGVEAGVAVVRVERLERRREHDAAEVEDHRPEHGGAR